jgi:hypothetical protein
MTEPAPAKVNMHITSPTLATADPAQTHKEVEVLLNREGVPEDVKLRAVPDCLTRFLRVTTHVVPVDCDAAGRGVGETCDHVKSCRLDAAVCVCVCVSVCACVCVCVCVCVW